MEADEDPLGRKFDGVYFSFAAAWSRYGRAIYDVLKHSPGHLAEYQAETIKDTQDMRALAKQMAADLVKEAAE